MPPRTAYTHASEPLVVRLAARGDRPAFEELVRRRQSWVRNLLRRLSRDASLADDLAQRVFILVWRTLGQLRDPARFPGWLKRVAVNVWLQHQRKRDPVDASEPLLEHDEIVQGDAGTAIDLDHALAQLPSAVRLCIVLSYHAEMSHAEIAEVAALPLGTVKSHVRRGTERLESLLSAYDMRTSGEVES